MIHKTRGIVFQFTRFRETSIIVKIFTETFGLQSYIVNGVRSSKSSGNKMALFQPLTLLDMVVYHRDRADINRIKEVKCLYPYQSIPTDVAKSTQCIFLNEIMLKTVREEGYAHDVFDFIFHSMLTLDHQEKEAENFHLIFLIKLSRYLGFGIETTDRVAPWGLTDDDRLTLARLITADYTHGPHLTGPQRRMFLDLILKFYGEHIETFGEIKSVQILREVLL